MQKLWHKKLNAMDHVYRKHCSLFCYKHWQQLVHVYGINPWGKLFKNIWSNSPSHFCKLGLFRAQGEKFCSSKKLQLSIQSEYIYSKKMKLTSGGHLIVFDKVNKTRLKSGSPHLLIVTSVNENMRHDTDWLNRFRLVLKNLIFFQLSEQDEGLNCYSGRHFHLRYICLQIRYNVEMS
jgi:hypothetical protein